MQKTRASATRPEKVRRSSRLNLRYEGIISLQMSCSPLLTHSGLKSDPVNVARRPARRKISNPTVSSPCTTELVKPRRSQRITPSELAKRELALIKNEEDHRRRAEEQLSSIKKLEDEANLMLIHAREREAKATLAQLEDHFTCALYVLFFLSTEPYPSHATQDAMKF